MEGIKCKLKPQGKKQTNHCWFSTLIPTDKLSCFKFCHTRVPMLLKIKEIHLNFQKLDLAVVKLKYG